MLVRVYLIAIPCFHLPQTRYPNMHGICCEVTSVNAMTVLLDMFSSEALWCM